MILSLILSAIIAGQSAFLFDNTLGFNLHLDQPGIWQQYGLIESLLRALNVKSVRTSGTIYGDTSFTFLGAARLKFMNQLNTDLGITSDEVFGANTSLKQILTTLSLRKGVAYLEGPNELDLADASWIIHDQQTVANLAMAHALFPSVSVIAPAVAIDDPAELGDLSQEVQYGNVHVYTGRRNPEVLGWGNVYWGQLYGSLGYNLAKGGRNVPGLPIIATEAGFSTALVSESTQASYLERMLLWNNTHGIPYTYTYSLFDDSESYGIARTDGSLKPSAYGLQGLMTTLADALPYAGNCSLDATITTNAKYEKALYCKSNGEHDLVLWEPTMLQDPNTATPLLAPTAPVKITAKTKGKTFLYSQSTQYRWSHVEAPQGALDATLSERPIIAAFDAQPVFGVPLPILGTGIVNGKPIPPGGRQITPIF
jgi:hypothetical protein